MKPATRAQWNCQVTNQTPLFIVQCTVWEKIFPRLSDVSGDVDAVIRAALSSTNCDVVVVRVCEGEMLHDAREFSAVVISGSPVMVGDPPHGLNQPCDGFARLTFDRSRHLAFVSAIS
jgi:hypothetical protein